MNYFAHGCRFVDRPYFLVGTALPDMLRVSDPGVRVRSKGAQPWINEEQSPTSEIAAGILQHLEDDDWFHSLPTFIELTGVLSRLFREAAPEDSTLRAPFLGHIVTELLLDAALTEKLPGRLEAYYTAITQVDPDEILAAVNRISRTPATRLAEFLPLFHREQFLWDYADSTRLLFRLNQVMRRVGLPILPVGVVKVLDEARPMVAARVSEMVPFTL